jgi:hypothetical protein
MVPAIWIGFLEAGGRAQRTLTDLVDEHAIGVRRHAQGHRDARCIALVGSRRFRPVRGQVEVRDALDRLVRWPNGPDARGPIRPRQPIDRRDDVPDSGLEDEPERVHLPFDLSAIAAIADHAAATFPDGLGQCCEVRDAIGVVEPG